MNLNLILLLLLLTGSAKGQGLLESFCKNIIWISLLCASPVDENDTNQRQPVDQYQCTSDPDPKAAALIESQYDFEFGFRNVPMEDQVMFRSAANRWRQVVVGDVADASRVFNFSPCGLGPSSVDDIYICAMYAPIDESGSTVGYAIPTALRSGENAPLTIVGTMVFDTDDLDFPDFESIIVHEMGHLLGIGGLWFLKPGIMDRPVAGDFCPYRSDTKASREWNCLTGCDRIPIEHDSENFGSDCVHWDETCLKREALTPFLNGREDQPLSKITAASLEDLGYTVSYDGVDPISRDDINPSCLCNRRLGEKGSSSVGENHANHSPAKTAAKLDAFEFGKQMLRKQREELARMRRSLQDEGIDDNWEDSGVDYVGGKWISVVYKEPDTSSLYSLIVTDNDLDDSVTQDGELGD